MKIAACVILYNPKDTDLKNIETYLSKVEKVFVFDNTETRSNESFFKDNKNIDFFWTGENKGLSILLNQACTKAIEEGFDFLLTMDQDSSFTEQNIDNYLLSISNFKEKETTAVFGLKYHSENIELKKTNAATLKQEHLITSGSVLNLKLYPEIGGFDENLFIDFVDIDYCYSASIKGFDSIEFQNIFLKHNIGEPIYRHPAFLPFNVFKKRKVIHSPIRVYYMYRNLLYFEKKYQNDFPELIKKVEKDYKYHIKKCLKYSDDFFLTLRYLLKAKRDFKENRMGKIN